MERLKIIREESAEGCGPGCGCSGGTEAGAAAETPSANPPAMDLDEARRRLDQQSGKHFWRSLEELSADPGFEAMVRDEFPRQAAEWGDGLSRRRFLQLSSASLALAGLTACTRQPEEKIVAYVEQPEQVVPGQPLYFATACPSSGYGGGTFRGILAESHMGRPTKVEGNPEHPASLGATDLTAQASVLQLYDPDRSRTPEYLGRIRLWDDLVADLGTRMQALRGLGGEGLRILTGTVTSPTLGRLLGDLMDELPQARWHQWDATGRHNAFAGAERAFGRPADVHYDLSAADVVLSLDADFLNQGPGAVRYARDWAQGRDIVDPADASAMGRLYVVETHPSGTGSAADHRLALAPAQIAGFALALAARLGVATTTPPSLDEEASRWVDAVAEDLQAHQGRAVVIPGDGQPAALHALAHAMNEALGAFGTTAIVTEPVAERPVDQLESITTLAEDLRAGRVDLLLVFGTNPAYDAPADLEFADALIEAGTSVHLGLYKDETAEYCQWHVPMTHYLEGWSDGRAYDGTASIVQPLIEPLYRSRSPEELVAVLAEQAGTGAYDLVRSRWQGELPGGDFERAWKKVLHDGVVPDTAAPRLDGVAVAGVAEAASELATLAGEAGDGFALCFAPDPSLGDGSWANNGWLQEVPKPVTKLTWDNALLMSPGTAEALGLDTYDERLGANASSTQKDQPMVTVQVGERSLDLPVFRVPGHADGAVTVHLGFGRTRAGQVGDGQGFDTYRLRTSDALWTGRATLTPSGATYPMASTQAHHSLDQPNVAKRHLVREASATTFQEDPEVYHHMGHPPPEGFSFYPPRPYEGHKWGMTVDLSTCTGCNACVVACQSENNIPVVGKEQVLRGREMHWIRVDLYYEGWDHSSVERLHNQPVLCMQCELAPCEPVCPVAATVHSQEGLNDMVYNRCVGTRYCSNNCPYKVRRFNFLKYNDFDSDLAKMNRNPDVTVRARGVMEKCTYCVQRISHARIQSKVEARNKGTEPTIPDGSLKTACQQVCPSGALVFGDLNDPDAEVTRRHASPRNYSLLEELGTRPRTTYLARVRNLNPALATESDHGSH